MVELGNGQLVPGHGRDHAGDFDAAIAFVV